MSYFKCPHCSFDPGAHAWSGMALASHKWEAHQIPSCATFNRETHYYPDKESWDEYKSKLRGARLYPVLSLLKKLKKGLSKKLDLSKSQLFWPSLSRLGIDASFDVCCSATDRALHDSPYSVAYINFFSGFHNY